MSQSARFGLFTHNYLYNNATDNKWKIFGPNARPNTYKGSAV